MSFPITPVLQSGLSNIFGAGVKLWDSSYNSAPPSSVSINMDSLFQMSSSCLGIQNSQSVNLLDIQVVILPSNRVLHYTIDTTDTVQELKGWIEQDVDIPRDKIHLKLNGQALDNDSLTLSCAGVGYGNTFIYMMVCSPGDMFCLDIAQLDLKFDCDFTIMQRQFGERFERGGYEYNRPYGWYRVGLRVQNKYESDVWLGTSYRFDQHRSVPGEWPVSYHGTRRISVEGIVTEGFRAGGRALFGPGVYTCPSIDVVANLYAEPFQHTDGQWYQIVFQNRVNPYFLNIVDTVYTRVGADYWVSYYQNVDWNVHHVRPYGILIRKVPF